jgi:hypothetical protein
MLRGKIMKKLFMLSAIGLFLITANFCYVINNYADDIPPDVKREISRLGSMNWSLKTDAAYKLGLMGPKAAPAIPSLILTLCDDEEKLVGGIRGHGYTSPAHLSAIALVKIGNPSVEPLIKAMTERECVRKYGGKVLANITGAHFGEDPLAWQQWWNQKKTKEEGISKSDIDHNKDFNKYEGIIRQIGYTVKDGVFHISSIILEDKKMFLITQEVLKKGIANAIISGKQFSATIQNEDTFSFIDERYGHNIKYKVGISALKGQKVTLTANKFSNQSQIIDIKFTTGLMTPYSDK